MLFADDAEDQRPGAGYNRTASHHRRWLLARCRWTVHISGLHHHWQPLLGHRSIRGIGNAATTLARLTSRVWTIPKLTVETKMVVYNACVVSTLMYGNETWTTSARQEKRLNTFHMRSIRRILGISWQDRISNAEVLSRANLPSMFTLLRQRRLRWLGHIYHIEDGRIPKDNLYGELASGRRTKGRPQLHYKDICKRDMQALDLNTESWEDLEADRTRWRSTLSNTSSQGKRSRWT